MIDETRSIIKRTDHNLRKNLLAVLDVEAEKELVILKKNTDLGTLRNVQGALRVIDDLRSLLTLS